MGCRRARSARRGLWLSPAPWAVAISVVLFLTTTSGAVLASTEAAVGVLSRGERVEWRRGELPVLKALPRTGEGWLQLADRLAGDAGRAGALREANPGLARPLRDVRVSVPWALLRADLRVAALLALFPADRRTPAGWEHHVASPWLGEGESWWEIAEVWCGDASAYQSVREANPLLGMYPPAGSRVFIPSELLAPEFRAASPPSAAREMAQSPGPEVAPTNAPAPAGATSATAPSAEPGQSASAGSTAAQGEGPTALPGRGDSRGPASLLEYRGDVAVYRLRPGEALYSAVVVRFTGLIYAVDVNASAARIALMNGIADVTDIPIGYPILIPFDLLLPEYLPVDNPRRIEWEKGLEELAAIRRAIRAANLDGIHIILDAGHGGGDTGATAAGIWESTYAYDVMARLRRVLERETKATVWTTVRDLSHPLPPDIDVLPQSRRQRLLVQPPYDLSESSTGVQLRWVLSNAILSRLVAQKVDPERVAFVSIHADSLHPSVGGLMVYVPDRTMRPSRGPSPRRFSNCREAREVGAPSMSSAFRARSQALSTQLANAITEATGRSDLAVHDYLPVRGYVRRGSSRFVPAVLRYNLVPTSVLVEICNLNNASDRGQLLTWRYRERLAHAIAAGLAEGFAR